MYIVHADNILEKSLPGLWLANASNDFMCCAC